MAGVWIIVCGLIRNPANALHQAREIARLKASGLVEGVVISTWIGDLERHPEVRAAFQGLGATFVASPEPGLVTPGHVLHQSRSMLAALAECPADSWILRIRPDIAPLNSLFDGVCRLEWVEQHRARQTPTHFEHPVWAHSGLLLWPMYMNDIVFCAHRDDVLRLVDIDLKDELLYNEMAPEQFFHLRPLLRDDPIMRIQAQVQRGPSDAAANAALAEILWASPLWARALARYARSISANYTIGFLHPLIAHSDENLAGFGEFPISALIRDSASAPQIASMAGLKTPVFNSGAWADALLTGRLARCAAGDMIADALAGRLAGDPEAEAADLAEQLARQFPAYKSKLPKRTPDGVVYQETVERFIVRSALASTPVRPAPAPPPAPAMATLSAPAAPPFAQRLRRALSRLGSTRSE